MSQDRAMALSMEQMTEIAGRAVMSSGNAWAVPFNAYVDVTSSDRAKSASGVPGYDEIEWEAFKAGAELALALRDAPVEGYASLSAQLSRMESNALAAAQVDWTADEDGWVKAAEVWEGQAHIMNCAPATILELAKMLRILIAEQQQARRAYAAMLECRSLAGRHRKEPWAKEILDLCRPASGDRDLPRGLLTQRVAQDADDHESGFVAVADDLDRLEQIALTAMEIASTGHWEATPVKTASGKSLRTVCAKPSRNVYVTVVESPAAEGDEECIRHDAYWHHIASSDPATVLMLVRRARLGDEYQAQPSPELFPLPENLFDSKDWRAADYAGRVEWLVNMYRGMKQQADQAWSMLADSAASRHVPGGGSGA